MIALHVGGSIRPGMQHVSQSGLLFSEDVALLLLSKVNHDCLLLKMGNSISAIKKNSK